MVGWLDIKIDVKEIGVNMSWIDLALDSNCWKALVNVTLNFHIP